MAQGHAPLGRGVTRTAPTAALPTAQPTEPETQPVGTIIIIPGAPSILVPSDRTRHRTITGSRRNFLRLNGDGTPRSFTVRDICKFVSLLLSIESAKMLRIIQPGEVSLSKLRGECNEPYVRTTSPRTFRGVRRGTPTAATHVSSPTKHRATRATTPTLRGRYIRRDGTPRRGNSAGATIRIAPERRSRRTA